MGEALTPNKKKRLVSVVIPCYRSEKSIRDVVELTIAEFDKWDDYDCEFVLVNDCSPDNTYGTICELAQRYPNVHGVSLMRNFGQHSAIMCGLHFAKGDLVLGIDDDLQCHPSQIRKVLYRMDDGFDVVYGVYAKSKNGPIKNFTSWLNRVTSRKLLGRPKNIRSSNFWLITSQIKDQMIKYTNYNPYVDALFTRLTNRIGNVTIEHHMREYGTSNYTLSRLVNLWLASFNYTNVPIRLISGVGVITALVGFVACIVTIVRKVLDPSIAAGWSSIVCILLIFFGIVLLALGIIGEYLGNIVLSINSTPQFVIREKVNL